MFLGQTVGRGQDPCPLPGSRQARGQGSVVVPTPGWPGRAPADRSPQGGEAAGGGRLLGLYVSRWASGPAGFGDSFRTVSIFWPLEQRPGGPPPLVPGVCGAQPGGRRGVQGVGGLQAPQQVRLGSRHLRMVVLVWNAGARRSLRPRSAPRPRRWQVPTLAAAWVVSPSQEAWASRPGPGRASLHCAAPCARRGCRSRAGALRPKALGTPPQTCPTWASLCGAPR